MHSAAARTTALVVSLVVSLGICAGCSGGTGGPPKPLPNVGGVANGELSRKPAQVLADARGAMLAASSLHAVGDLMLASGPVTVDLMLTHDGSVSGSLASGRRRLQVLRTTGGGAATAYVRGDATLAGALGAAASATAAAATQADFVPVPPGAGAPVAGLSLQGLADRLLPGVPAVSPAAQVRLGDVDGVRAVVVTLGAATVAVSDDGAPRPLRFVGGAAVPGELTFTDDAVTPLPTLAPGGAGTLSPTP